MRLNLLLLEFAVQLQVWWTYPIKQAEYDIDEADYRSAFVRLFALVFMFEGLVAFNIILFLWTHGQISL